MSIVLDITMLDTSDHLSEIDKKCLAFEGQLRSFENQVMCMAGSALELIPASKQGSCLDRMLISYIDILRQNIGHVEGLCKAALTVYSTDMTRERMSGYLSAIESETIRRHQIIQSGDIEAIIKADRLVSNWHREALAFFRDNLLAEKTSVIA